MRDLIRLALCVGLLMLLMSALIVCAQPAEQGLAPLTDAPPPCAVSAYMPNAPHVQSSAPQPPKAAACRETAAVRTAEPQNGAAMLCCDHNGCVLSDTRYTRSVYPLFRSEAAAG